MRENADQNNSEYRYFARSKVNIFHYQQKYLHDKKLDISSDPVDTGRKLNVHKTFTRRPSSASLMHVQFTYCVYRGTILHEIDNFYFLSSTLYHLLNDWILNWVHKYRCSHWDVDYNITKPFHTFLYFCKATDIYSSNGYTITNSILHHYGIMALLL